MQEGQVQKTERSRSKKKRGMKRRDEKMDAGKLVKAKTGRKEDRGK